MARVKDLVRYIHKDPPLFLFFIIQYNYLFKNNTFDTYPHPPCMFHIYHSLHLLGFQEPTAASTSACC